MNLNFLEELKKELDGVIITDEKLSEQEKEGKLVLEVKVNSDEDGRIKVEIYADAYDSLTEFVFLAYKDCWGEEKEGVRHVKNGVYTECDECYPISSLLLEYDNEEDAIENVKKIIKEVAMYRKEVRKLKEQQFFVLI